MSFLFAISDIPACSYGLLHRIPPVREGSQSDAQSYEDEDVFVPADHEEYQEQGYDEEAHSTGPVSEPDSHLSSLSRDRRTEQATDQHESRHYLDPPIRPTVTGSN